MLSEARAQKRPVGALRQDNAGKNKAIEDHCKESDWQLNVKFEYTARATPQQNLLVETSFTVIAARARAMILRGRQIGR